MSLLQLVYSSRPFGFEDATLYAILHEARRHNAQVGITGCLICRADLYLQWLEGPPAAVESTYARIRRDDRHDDVVRRLHAPADHRLFPDWAMKDDPARSWLWTREEVAGGALARASEAEVRQVFKRVAAGQARMQLLEASLWGLRSARIRLSRPGKSLSVTLFPMLHIGEPALYDAVYSDALRHDVVLVEGVNSPVVQHITRSYRWVSGSKISDLVVQPKLPRIHDGGAEIVSSDLSGAEFEAAWREVPLWMRALLLVAGPLVGLRQRRKTREQIAEGLSLEDAASQKELVEWSPEAGLLSHVILDLRDRRLLAHLDQQLDLDGSRSIAVVYGAMHMRAVFRHLIHERGFTNIETEWMTVFAV